jgi:Ser/Thr protein kinase RdoA (MazF antagonist)
MESIPEAHRESARAALSAAFGASAPVEVRPVGGGASGALVYRVAAEEGLYLLRLETKRDALRNPHQYVCMQTAAEAGIAPALLYLDATAGVAIMDFVPQRPLAEYPGGALALARDLGSLAARLRDTSPFPALHDYRVMLTRMLGWLRSRLFVDGLLEPHVAAFERIRDAYPWDAAALASCHNDPNPRNILFDGQRLWLIDWETAYRNEPLADVAILADNFAQTPELESALLGAWLGRAPDRALRARLTLMRPLTRLYYAALLLGIAGARAPRPEPEKDLTAPSPAEFGAAVARGEHTPASAETMYVLGKMMLAGFLAGATDQACEAALAVARSG